MAIGVEIQDLTFKAAEEADKLEIQADGGGLGSSFYTTVQSVVDYFNNTGMGGVQSIVAGDNVVVDNTNPVSPIVSVPNIGVENLNAGPNISITGTPENPTISASGVVTSVTNGDSLDLSGTATDPVLSLSDNIKAGSASIVTLFEVGTGTLNIGNLATGTINIGGGATGDIFIGRTDPASNTVSVGPIDFPNAATTGAFHMEGGWSVDTESGDFRIRRDAVTLLSVFAADDRVKVTNQLELNEVIYTFPPDAGTSGQFLTTDGTGVLTWTTGGGGGGGVAVENSGIPIANASTLNFSNNFLATDAGSGVVDIAHNPAVHMPFNANIEVQFGASSSIKEDSSFGNALVLEGTDIVTQTNSGDHLLGVGPSVGGINGITSGNIVLQSTATSGIIQLNSAGRYYYLSPAAGRQTIRSEDDGANTTTWIGHNGNSLIQVDVLGILLDYARWPSTDGTAGQTLTTNGSGTLSWANAGGGGGGGLLGTFICRPTSAQAITNNINFQASNSIVFDIANVLKNDLGLTLSNNTEIPVPVGVSYVKVTASVTFFSSSQGVRGLQISPTPANYRIEDRRVPAGSGAQTSIELSSYQIPVTDSDVISIVAMQSSGGDLNTVPGGTWIMVEYYA